MLLIKAYKKLLKMELGLEENCSDSKIVIELMRNPRYTLDDIDVLIKNTKFNRNEFMILCLLNENFYKKYLPRQYKESKSFILEFSRRNLLQNGIAPLDNFKDVSPKLKSDLSFLKGIVKIDGYIITDDCIINTQFYNSGELRECANEYFLKCNGIRYLVEDIEHSLELTCEDINNLNNSYNFAKAQGSTYDEGYKKQLSIYNKDKQRYEKQLKLLKSLKAYNIQSNYFKNLLKK